MIKRFGHHIVELDTRLEGERGVSASLRTDVISERGRADRAEGRASEAEWDASDARRQLRKQEERMEERIEEALGEFEDAEDSAMRHISEVKELKGHIRGLKHELAILKGAA